MHTKVNSNFEHLHPSFGSALEPKFTSSIDGGLLSKASLLHFIRTFFNASKVTQGYYLEFGVFNGQSIIETYGILRGLLTRVYGFDSFAGLPSLSAEDSASLNLTPSFAEGNFKSLPIEVIRSYILASSTRLGDENLVLTQGFFNDSLPKFNKTEFKNKGPCLVAHVDCDLYSSSKDVFSFLDDIVTTGTWLLLDDYWLYRGSPKHGQRRAFEEWIADSKRVGATDYASYNGFSRAFILYEK
jgi:hypothetical protein